VNGVSSLQVAQPRTLLLGVYYAARVVLPPLLWMHPARVGVAAIGKTGARNGQEAARISAENGWLLA
jgi:hypothetical protein